MTPKQSVHQVELSQLIYTMNWEDPEADHRALAIQPGDSVMTITSGACNTLGFLLCDPAVIHTVDINPTQAFLLELKMAGIRHLRHGEYMRLLGLAPGNDRLGLYGRCRTELSPGAARFWDGQPELLSQGFLFRGRYERFVRVVGRCTRVIQGGKRVDRLFDHRDLDGQRAFYARSWATARTRLVFGLFYNKFVLARAGLKGDYFRFDDGSHSFAESFRRKFGHVACSVPIHGNYFLHVYLKGGYRSLREVPDYLLEENYPVIRQRLDRIRIHTADAKKWLATMPGDTFECLALSNICELMSLDDTRVFFEEVLRTAKPGARASLRNLILPRDVPGTLQSRIVKDERLSDDIKAADRSFVYSKVAAYRVNK